jgi:jouberin
VTELEKVTEEAAPPPDDGRILAIRIHRTDKLRTEIFILHPVVRVHLVDMDTGQYLKKTSR